MSPNRQNYFRQKIAEMKKHRTLASQTSYYRGFQQLAPIKAGFFYGCTITGLSCFDTRPVFTERFGDALPAKVDLFAAVQHGSLFLSVSNANKSHYHAQFHTNTRTSRSASATLRGTRNPICHLKSAGSRTASPYFQIHGAVNKDSGRTPRTLAGNPANAERRVPGVKSIHTLLKSFQPSARRLA